MAKLFALLFPETLSSGVYCNPFEAAQGTRTGLCLVLLLFQGLQSHGLLVLIHARSGRLLNHTQRLLRLHVDHLRDAALHDEEVRIVDVQRHRMEPGPFGGTTVAEVLLESHWISCALVVLNGIGFVENQQYKAANAKVCRNEPQILNLILLHIVRVQEVSISTSNHNLACDDDLVVHLIPE